ncbi:MAG: tail fiber domain-containing protein [Wenzhouxiangella sp.]
MKHQANRKSFSALLLAALWALIVSGWVQAQVEPGFTYQGELRVLGTPTEGQFDFRFRLYNGPSGGPQVGPQLTLPAVAVDDGVFTVHLDFGAAALTNAPRWLEIDVRPSGDPSYETLAPRTLLATVPYAWNAARALPGSVGSASIQAGSVGVTQIDANAVQRRIANPCPAGEFIRAVNADGSAVCAPAGGGGGDAWLLGGNAGTDPAINYIGTSDNQPLVLGANGQRLVRIEALSPGTNAATANIVMGNPANTIAAGARGATISGGGVPAGAVGTIVQPNRIFDNFGTIGGGQANIAGLDNGNPSSAPWATVGGGLDNQAGGQGATVSGGEKNFAINNQATIGGGNDNVVFGVAGTIAGGVSNVVRGIDSVIVGGGFNAARGAASTVGGGRSNCAGGNFSWAGGQNAKIRPAETMGESLGTGCFQVPTSGNATGDQGTFMWSDAQSGAFQSTGNNQFLVRAGGGVFFGTAGPVNLPTGRFINTSTGAHLTTGGTWTNASSRAFKTDFLAVDPLEILDRLIQLPMSTWTYLSAPENGRHLGPIAEEFHASFGLGSDSDSITTVDASGVALAAIQGLNQRLEAENAALRNQNAEQDAAIAELRAELNELRGLLLQTTAQGQ